MKKKLTLALCLATIGTPLPSEESLVETAWQCGRDYIIGAARYGTIYRNQTGPYRDPDDVNLAETRALGAPDDFPIQKEYRWKQNKLFYRGVREAQTAGGTEMSDPDERHVASDKVKMPTD